jgi:uncharacterized membrane protein YhaH (DUF805 family)
MKLVSLFLSFSGRINRARYWLGTLVLLALAVGIAAAFVGQSERRGLVRAAVGLLLLFLVYSRISVSAKRFHDRGMSGWTASFAFAPVPILVAAEILQNDLLAVLGNLFSVGIEIWFFIELGCLRGDAGPNLFGPASPGA